MNECLMTPQHEKQIGYWVSEKDKLLYNQVVRYLWWSLYNCLLDDEIFKSESYYTAV